MFTMHSNVLLARRDSISIKRRSTGSAPRKHAAIESLAFSGCGWLGCFHLGVAHHLKSVGALTSETKLAGTSGGALVAVAVGCGLEPRVLLEELKLIGNHCDINGTFWRLRDPLRAMINQVLYSLLSFILTVFCVSVK
jgi:predicted acylesterase/phospholipase RssA